MGADALALGQATTAMADNQWAIFSNPANIEMDKRSLSFYSLRNYGFAELTDIATSGVVLIGSGVISFGFHRYGESLFSESTIRLGYAKRWSNVRFGGVLSYNHISQAEPYGSGGAIGLDVGLSAELTNELILGARTSNINQPEYPFEAGTEPLSRELAIGINYRMYKTAMFLFDVVKDVRFPVSYRSGIELKMIENLQGRIGITSEPNTYSFGFGYGTDLWETNISFQRHETLGFSPGVGLSMFF